MTPGSNIILFPASRNFASGGRRQVATFPADRLPVVSRTRDTPLLGVFIGFIFSAMVWAALALLIF